MYFVVRVCAAESKLSTDRMYGSGDSTNRAPAAEQDPTAVVEDHQFAESDESEPLTTAILNGGALRTPFVIGGSSYTTGSAGVAIGVMCTVVLFAAAVVFAMAGTVGTGNVLGADRAAAAATATAASVVGSSMVDVAAAAPTTESELLPRSEPERQHVRAQREHQKSSAAAETNPKPFEFPSDFEFATATSAYQVEGAVDVDGRGPSIWDTFSAEPGRVAHGDTGAVGIDQYHRFDQDIALMQAMGVRSYRFSISPTRIFPNGTAPVNEAGVAHYNRLIDALLKAGIKPYVKQQRIIPPSVCVAVVEGCLFLSVHRFVTMYHWDLAQKLHDAYGVGESRITI